MLVVLLVGCARRRAERVPRHDGRAPVDRRHDRHADALPRPRREHPRRTNSVTELLDCGSPRSACSRSRTPSALVGRLSSSSWRSSSGWCSTPRRSGARSTPSDCSPRPREFSGIRVKRIKFELYVLSGADRVVRRHPVDLPLRDVALRRRHRPGADGRRHRALRRRVDLRRARLDHRRRAVGGDHRLPATGDDVAQDRSPGAATSSPACCSCSASSCPTSARSPADCVRARRRRPDATASPAFVLAAAANGAPDQIPPSHPPTSTPAPSSTTTTNISKG